MGVAHDGTTIKTQLPFRPWPNGEERKGELPRNTNCETKKQNEYQRKQRKENIQFFWETPYNATLGLGTGSRPSLSPPNP